jgi:hypothetical protein
LLKKIIIVLTIIFTFSCSESSTTSSQSIKEQPLTFDFGGGTELRARWRTVSKSLINQKLDLNLIEKIGSAADTESAVLLDKTIFFTAVIDKKSKKIKEMYILSDPKAWQTAMGYALIMFETADLRHNQQTLSYVIDALKMTETTKNLGSSSVVLEGVKYSYSVNKETGMMFIVQPSNEPNTP